MIPFVVHKFCSSRFDVMSLILIYLFLIVINLLYHVKYSGDEKDQKILKSLRSEKQGILDDLKEKTKFYEIQQMIQVI